MPHKGLHLGFQIVVDPDAFHAVHADVALHHLVRCRGAPHLPATEHHAVLPAVGELLNVFEAPPADGFAADLGHVIKALDDVVPE